MKTKNCLRAFNPAFPFLTLGFAAFALPLGAATTAATDYVGFGVNATTLYGFTDYSTREVIETGLVTDNDHLNHLATDPTRNRLLFTQGLYDPTIHTLYSWDFNLNGGAGALVSVGEIPNIGHSSGGGSFWNDAYYLFDDQDTTNNGIVKITFDLTGAIDTVTHPFGQENHPTDLGDIAITQSGTMYILAKDGFYSLDVTNEMINPTYTLLSGDHLSPDGQLFFDADGDLLTRNGQNWEKIIIDGNSYTVEVKDSSVLSETYADLSSPLSFIPEPTTPLLTALGLLVFLGRRRRN